jgi:hypothetical protein
MTHLGAMIFTDVTGEQVADEVAPSFYPDILTAGATLVWAIWRKPTHDELVRAWPARGAADNRDRAGGGGGRQPSKSCGASGIKRLPSNELWRRVERRRKGDGRAAGPYTEASVAAVAQTYLGAKVAGRSRRSASKTGQSWPRCSSRFSRAVSAGHRGELAVCKSGTCFATRKTTVELPSKSLAARQVDVATGC